MHTLHSLRTCCTQAGQALLQRVRKEVEQLTADIVTHQLTIQAKEASITVRDREIHDLKTDVANLQRSLDSKQREWQCV